MLAKLSWPDSADALCYVIAIYQGIVSSITEVLLCM